MHVFLDTNVLLSLYKLSGTDLEELKKVVKLVEAGKVTVHLNDHVCDEYWRNREAVIKECLDRFTAGKGSQVIPNLLMPYKRTQELRKALGAAAALVQEIREQADKDSRSNQLEADLLIEELFKLSKPTPIKPETVSAAESRRARGNPPGKANSLGDAINWEWLIESFPHQHELHIVSADGDYESELHTSEVKEFLAREWRTKKQSNLYLHKSLPLFLKAKFPDIKLADEIAKTFAVERLENSWNFSATHEAIKYLEKYSDFSDDLLLRLLNAYTANSQVHWILGDADVRAFADKLLAQAKSKAVVDKAAELKTMLDAIDAKLKQSASVEDDPDEIPF